MNIWIDVTNTPHVNVLRPLISRLSEEHELNITARAFSETATMLDELDIEFALVGTHGGKSRLRKISSLLQRVIELNSTLPAYDLSISLGGNYTSLIGLVRKSPSIVISDNDISFKAPAYLFGSYFVVPRYFDTARMRSRFLVKPDQIYTFNGFKEDLYIADYVPDPSSLDVLPFKEFITIRPENLKASYVPRESVTIVPELFARLKDENILFLPRYPEERAYASGYDNVFIPDNPLPGLDVCYYTKVMLTGAGTFAREAALLGTPSVSFFPGVKSLTVDRIMQQEGLQFKSRSPDEIADYVRSKPSIERRNRDSRVVLDEVLSIIDQICAKVSP